MTGKIADNSFVVVMDKDGQLKAFHNVCRHHAAPVASGTGCIEKFAVRLAASACSVTAGARPGDDLQRREQLMLEIITHA